MKEFSTTVPAFADAGLETLFNEHGVIVAATSAEGGNSLLTMLFTLGPVLLLVGGMFWLFRRYGSAASGGIFGMGKSQAKRYDRTRWRPAAYVRRCGGHREAKAEFVEVVDFLKEPGQVHLPGRRRPERRAADRCAGHR